MVDLNYKRVAELLRSGHADEARKAFVEVAAELGFGSTIEAALDGAAQDDAIDGARLKDAFQQFEWLRMGRNGRAHERFSEYANFVARLAAQANAVRALGRSILNAVNEDGKQRIESPLVRGHIEEVLSLLDEMGTAYLHAPASWDILIDNSFKDFWMINIAIHSIIPREWDNPYRLYKRLVMRANQLALKARAEYAPDDAERLNFERMSEKINQALEDGEFDTVLQIALEIWVLTVGTKRAFDAYKEVLHTKEAGGGPQQELSQCNIDGAERADGVEGSADEVPCNADGEVVPVCETAIIEGASMMTSVVAPKKS